ncbi:MAG: hypothetical protein ACUVTB_04985 [Candidatus Bathycorpusculaceae bacterium]
MALLILQLLFILFLIIVIGEPARFLIFKRFNLFSNLDFAQVFILDVYIGGLILYIVAILPFRFFNTTILLSFTLLCLIFSFILHYEALKRIVSILTTKTFFAKINKASFYSHALVFTMFIIFLIINLFSVSNFIFDSVRDGSIHSLYVQVILENKNIPLTLQPYLQEGIIYPQASHVIFAFASYFLNLEVPQVVFYTTILFKSLSIVAAFFLGIKLGFNKMYSAGLSFVFAFISCWPLFITWGGNPFATGFPLFLICLGLFFPLSYANRKFNYNELLAIGLLFGYLGSIIISYLQVLMVIAFFVLVYYIIKKKKVLGILFEFALIFGISLLPLSPFVYRFFLFYPYPGHNIGVPSDFVGWSHQQFFVAQALQWAFENLSPYFLLQLLTILFLVVLGVLLWKTRDYGDVKPIIVFALVIFVSALLLSFLSFFLPADFGIVSWGHQGIIMSIFVNLLIFIFYVLLSRYLKLLLGATKTKSLIVFVLLSLITVPFLYYRLAVDPMSLQGAYGVYAVTTKDDYNLMLWMKENLSDAVILVHPYEAGLFIPSISHHKIIFPYSGSSLSLRYQRLVRLIESNVMNLSTYELISDLGASHVFVGARVAFCEGYSIWASELFLGNPNFRLVKNFGNAYLFKFNFTDPYIVFLDDFEHMSWQQNRWLSDAAGTGMGNVSLVSGFGQNASRCLMLAAQAMPTVWNWRSEYAYWVSREIFVLNNSDVTLSLYFNVTQGFSGRDTFAILLSNIQRTQSMVVATTSKGVYENCTGVIILNKAEGFFEFKGNESLSELWRQRFNSPLPVQFILEFVTWDFDGIKNLVYIDNVQVTSTSSSKSLED